MIVSGNKPSPVALHQNTLANLFSQLFFIAVFGNNAVLNFILGLIVGLVITFLAVNINTLQTSFMPHPTIRERVLMGMYTNNPSVSPSIDPEEIHRQLDKGIGLVKPIIFNDSKYHAGTCRII